MNEAAIPLPLDHVVIAVRDLAQAVADYEQLGFTVLAGGSHPGRVSHNALVVFADGAYLELIAWRGDNQERWYKTLLADGPGLVDFALLPHDTMQVLAAAQARGLTALHGPVDGGRLRPDGRQLQWRSARSTSADLPFLCGDVTPRAWRVPDDAISHHHANGATGIASLSVCVRDLDASVARYRALLGPGAQITVDADAGLRRARIALTGCTLALLCPDAESGTDHPLVHRLQQRGEGPCSLRLRGSETTPPPLARPLCQGVDLAWA